MLKIEVAQTNNFTTVPQESSKYVVEEVILCRLVEYLVDYSRQVAKKLHGLRLFEMS